MVQSVTVVPKWCAAADWCVVRQVQACRGIVLLPYIMTTIYNQVMNEFLIYYVSPFYTLYTQKKSFKSLPASQKQTLQSDWIQRLLCMDIITGMS